MHNTNVYKYGLTALLIVLSTFGALAQRPVEMASAFRESGKIYVVVAVVALIFLGIIAYLIYLDKRLHSLEQKQAKKQALD